ncbi:sodium/calcium exchanger 3-like isoform X2 [Watersipora subatra]|uniref:sodium/calcium exchanger 3-like isoform X2 n=1 Tax=Watersipora subatra TaxID=2589382 RepID=UPI00355C4D6B
MADDENATCYTIEQVKDDYLCSNEGLWLPWVSEFTWSVEVRIILYLIALLWCFMGVSILADVFMCSIEKITSKTRKITIATTDKAGTEEVEIRVWNDTVANLTLMALGSSAPEILLSIIEIVGNNFEAGELGPSTIVGSAAFNLLVITAVCVIVIDSNEVRVIKSVKVFFITGFSCVFAYIWLIIVLVLITPNYIDIWEAVVTLLFFPILVLIAYVADKNFCSQPKKIRGSMELGFDDTQTKLLDKYKHLWKGGKVDKTVITQILKEIGKSHHLSDEDKAKLAAARISEEQRKSRSWYRVNASRKLFGGKSLEPRLNPQLSVILDRIARRTIVPLVPVYDDMKAKDSVVGEQASAYHGSLVDLSERGRLAVLEFTASSVAVLEREQKCKVGIRRYGRKDNSVAFRLETIDGSATAGEDYNPVKQTLVFQPDQTYIEYVVEIIDDNVYEPDETFFLKMALEPEQEAILGKKSINMITIINDDEPGTVEFAHPSFVFKESVGKAMVTVNRANGADGRIQVSWRSEDMTAKNGRDYEGGEGVLVFEHGEIAKAIEIPIYDDQDTEKDEHFKLILSDATDGAQLGSKVKTIVTIVNDEDYQGIVSRLVNLTSLNIDALKVDSATYAQQLENAVNVNGGDLESATAFDYIMHFLTFFWKVFFALVPPVHFCGGWLTFVCALMVMILMTIIVGDLASIFGCLCTLEKPITAITFVALGTSLPDLFASKQAAQMEATADNSVGNVTGSNSVNVFLGLGLPWTLAAIYHYAVSGKAFYFPAGTLSFSVMLYSIFAVVCLGILIFRHYVFPKGELGGASWFKWLTFAVMVSMWLLYVIISSLQVVELVKSPF